MTRDGEIPAIFNPKRVRAPSVVVTGDSPNGPYGGGFTNIINASNPQIVHQDSISSSQQDPSETIIIQHQHSQDRSYSSCAGVDSETPTTDVPEQTTTTRFRRLKACKNSCCSELAQKMYFGVCVTILVTASWVGATHCIKFLYLNRSTYTATIPQEDIKVGPALDDSNPLTVDLDGSGSGHSGEHDSSAIDTAEIFKIPKTTTTVFNAPFFAAWFFTNFAFLFFPIYILGRVALRKCDKPGEILGDVLRGFRDRGFTIGRFLNRCLSFCFLWLLSTYLYTLSLRVLFATEAMSLFATNVACVYLLSWVILHEQFVGVRIVAVILCDTGIALLAYMDGITGSPTLGGVVLAILAAAGYAIFRVMFRKVMGDPPVGQIAFTFTTLGFLNAVLLWPISLGLYLSGAESMPSDRLPWIILLIASVLLLVFHILTQFSAAVTYNMFVTLGLITAVPVSGALDVVLYGATFAGMKLAGVVLIGIGFFLVMFPENWPDYITRLLRKSGRAILRYQCCCEIPAFHSHSKYHLVGSQREMGERSPQRITSGPTHNRHRLPDGLHTIPSAITLWSCEMTDLSPSGYMHYRQQQQQMRQHSDDLPSKSTSVSSSQYPSVANNLHRQPPTGGGGGGGRLFSYFGNEHDRERKKSETSFFNLGFRRKSNAYYASTD